MIPNRLRISILLACMFHCFLYISCDQARSETKYSAEELPSIIIAYNLYAAHYNEFKCLWKKGEDSNFIVKLYAVLEQMDCAINDRMSFTHLAFISQGNTSGHFSGQVVSKDKCMNEDKQDVSTLFVTTPIATFGNKVLVILSSISPERTTIISVDDMLNADLLYDTIRKHLKGAPICSISSANVISPGIIKLEERGSGRCIPKGSSRSIVLDVASGAFFLKVGEEKLKPSAQ
jgi:hypothetical protein